MKFIDNKHEQFYYEKLKELQKNARANVYYKSLIYTLGISEITRTHFKEIFNVEEGKINIDTIQAGWQTSTSTKTTRMAFNLYNECIFDSMDDVKKEIKSSFYNPVEIFCCSYAPFFYEGIKIRYPEYTQEKNIFVRREL